MAKTKKPRKREIATTVMSNGKHVLVTVWDSFRQEAVNVAPEDVRQLRQELDAIVWEHEL